MGSIRDFQRRKSRGVFPAVLAVLALLAQLLIPAASLAAESAAAHTVTAVVCTADGAVEMAVPASPAHHEGFAGLQCHDCVLASVAAIAPGEPLTVPVRYAARIETLSPGEDRPQVRVRAPPRPPSTAPPAFPNA